MFDDLKQFISSDICLSCEGCCRFDKKKSDWRPKVGNIEEKKIAEKMLPNKQRTPASLVDQGGYLFDKLCNGVHACVFFNPENSACEIYETRPFECRIYPFVLVNWQQRPSVCVHLPCPYVQQKKDSLEYEQYILFLKEYFKNRKVLSLLEKNLHLFGDYSGYEQELEWVFDVSIN